ncbi:MAG: pyridoxal phosphate-dependent aminotransferase [Solirubrobacterales bacterium]|nr:pyridoxal phosphate-dependent aminotransferase [Solirubrobacterales bacterium]
MSAHPPLTAGVSRLGTESAFEVLGRARALEAEGVDVVHLELGEPDFPTPAHVVEAAAAAMRRGETGYCPAPGLPELRDAAARYLAAPRGLAIDSEEILVATGAKPFLMFAVLACAGPGDEVVHPDPGFPIYESVIAWSGATPVALPHPFDPERLAALVGPRTRLVILNSPNNPTGAVLAQSELRALEQILEGHDCWVLSDEVYARIVYGSPAPSVAALPALRERTLLVDSCSKTFAMTGWRCGFAAVPPALREPLTRMIINSTSCVPPFVQRAAVAALTGPMDAVDEMVRTFRRRRDTVVQGLAALPGVSCATPEGAFYAFPDVSGTGMSGAELAERLLVQEGVALLAGAGFGRHADAHLRISYAAAEPRLREGLARMGAMLERAAVQDRGRTAP